MEIYSYNDWLTWTVSFASLTPILPVLDGEIVKTENNEQMIMTLPQTDLSSKSERIILNGVNSAGLESYQGFVPLRLDFRDSAMQNTL